MGAVPKIYKVKLHDTLSGISVRFYGTNTYVEKIAQLNPYLYKRDNGRLSGVDLIFPGDELLMPETMCRPPRKFKKGELTMFVKDKELKYFNNVAFANSLTCISPGIQFDIPNNAENRKIFSPFNYETYRCYYGDELLVNGNVFAISASSTKTLRISAYNFAQHLMTCNLPTSAYPRTFQKASLKIICKKVLGSLDVKFNVTPSAKKDFNKRFESDAHIEFNESIGAFITQLATQRGLIVSPDSSTGGLLFESKGVGEIVLDFFFADVYDGLSMTYDSNYLFKHLTGVRPKTAKTPAKFATINNKFVVPNRNFVKTLSNGEPESLTEFIKQEDFSQKKQLFNINIEYPSINDQNGRFIKPNSIIVLKNEDFFINKAVKFLITRCDYNFVGNSVKMTAQPLNIFLGTEFEEFWQPVQIIHTTGR